MSNPFVELERKLEKVPVSRTEIEAHLYDEQSELMSNVIDAAVYALRKKIDLPGQQSLIQTRRGMGYVLQVPRGPGGGHSIQTSLHQRGKRPTGRGRRSERGR